MSIDGPEFNDEERRLDRIVWLAAALVTTSISRDQAIEGAIKMYNSLERLHFPMKKKVRAAK